MKRGFTLMEVMIGLALLGVALTVLIKSSANSIFNARQAQMMGVATDLSRATMYEIEEKLLKDGFTETDQSEGDIGEVERVRVVDPATGNIKFEEKTGSRSGKCFEDEGWPNVCYAYRIEQVELPSFEELSRMAQNRAQPQQGSGTGAGTAGDPEQPTGFQDSALGGMMSMLGGGMGGGGASADVEDAQGAAFLQGQYTMVQQVLKVSIRKVTLVVWWDVMGQERSLKTVAFFTDASAMDKVLMGLGSQELPESGGTSGGTSGGKQPTTPGGGSGVKR